MRAPPPFLPLNPFSACDSGMLQHDSAALQCAPSTACEANPDCDPDARSCDASACEDPDADDAATLQFFYCDALGGAGCQGPLNATACARDPQCSGQGNQTRCDPTQCAKRSFYTCNAVKAQCEYNEGDYPTDGRPYWNTTAACEASCFNADVTGVWRGLRVDSGFGMDE